MVCRRRWCNRAAMLAMGAMAGLWLAEARAGVGLGGAAPVVVPTAADFETASVKDMPGMRDAIIKAAPALAVPRDKYGDTVAGNFTSAGLGINSKRPEARLNAAILIHDLGTLSTDRYLVQMLPNDDAAVRYWAARGLTDISGPLVKTGNLAVQRAVGALSAQAKIEKSGVVEQEIVKALIQYGAFAPLLDALNAISNQMETSVPDAAMLQTAALGLDFVNRSMGSALAVDKIRAAGVAARLASFAAQQLKNNEAGMQTMDPKATVPAPYVAAVQRLVDGAAKVAGAAASKPYPTPTGASSDELLLNVNGLFGTPGGRAGTLQGDIKSVAVPPVAKTGQ
jgi:hypothetical protein